MSTPGSGLQHPSVVKPFLLWSALQGGLIIDAIALVALHDLLRIQVTPSQFADVLLWVGVAALVPPLVLQRVFQKAHDAWRAALVRGIGSVEETARQTQRWLLIGMAVNGVPAGLGLVYTLLCGRVNGGLGLCAGAFVIGLLYRPQGRR